MLFFGITVLFLVGIFFNTHFFWCHWLGFAGLWILYQQNRGNFLKGFFLPTWLVFFVVYAAYLFWLLKYKFWIYLVCVAGLSVLFPTFFLFQHFVTRKTKSLPIDALATFGFFLWLELAFSRAPFVGTAPLDPFFQPPIEILRITHLIDFRVWSAWLMATCFVAGTLVFRRSWKMLAVLILSVVAMGILAGLGNDIVLSQKKTDQHFQKIALIQHNLPFDEEWRSSHPLEVKQKYEALAMEAAKQNPDLIIFPQYTFPEDIYRQPDFFTELARKTKASILVASHVPAEAGKSVFDFGYMNLALLFTPEGKLGGVYQATEEAPFGEIRQRSAKKYQVIETPFGKLGILLCYEDVTSKAAGEASKAGADILVALSNPGMFLSTHMPYYHLEQDQLRVMETGLPLVRVSPNGYSAFIDETGQVVQQTQLNIEDVLYINY